MTDLTPLAPEMPQGALEQLADRIDAYFKKPNLWYENKVEANAILRAVLAALRASEGPREPKLVAVVDGRCDCPKCVKRNPKMYRMIGTCYNCGAKPILMLFRAGDPAAAQDCPVCGKWHAVESQRLATPDEIPIEAEGRQGTAAAQEQDR